MTATDAPKPRPLRCWWCGAGAEGHDWFTREVARLTTENQQLREEIARLRSLTRSHLVGVPDAVVDPSEA